MADLESAALRLMGSSPILRTISPGDERENVAVLKTAADEAYGFESHLGHH